MMIICFRLIDPAVMRLPIYLVWAQEISRIKKAHKAMNIFHGDVHQMNFVFHVDGFGQVLGLSSWRDPQ